ncbi:hypothetical protein RC74_11595 [Falsihalocynthiibacter arcticus]|uniref:DUF3626 domain-containing protein n=2 Tax=Falsihalocynthiibacter arcticus TaxID=1579316 RepID=A0A126V0H0_9RHOB|nr:hypothetical protein RC74_11595 [Falsihalocynthiibacter arcticus]
MQETASLMNKAIELTLDRDAKAAQERVLKHFDQTRADVQGNPLLDKYSKELVQVMVKLMRDADLNINFRAQEFFASSKSDSKYMTKFEKHRQAGAPMGDTRNEVEMKMFRYGERVGVDSSTATTGEKAAGARLASFAVSTSPKFAGVIRPRYCSVNFPSVIDGMGAQWGRSHFVLADHLKPNMTFIHTDSFDDVSSKYDPIAKTKNTAEHVQSTKMANYHHMQRLIVNMSNNLFELLMDTSLGDTAPREKCAIIKKKYNLSPTSYVEGHIHAELHFRRDIKKIRICNTEKNGGQKVAENIRNFATKYNIQVEYFD